MQSIPTFWIGERARVMKTELMIAKGYANKIFNITSITRDENNDQLCWGYFSGKDVDNIVSISAYYLSKS